VALRRPRRRRGTGRVSPAADGRDRRRRSAPPGPAGSGFSGLVAAAQLAEERPAGLDRLRDIAGRTLCRSCSGIGLMRNLSGTADPEGTVR
jgi:hypothetical protein